MSCAKGHAFFDCFGAMQNIRIGVLGSNDVRSCSGSSVRQGQSSLFLTLILHYHSHAYLFDRAHVKTFDTIYIRMFINFGYAHTGHPKFCQIEIIQNIPVFAVYFRREVKFALTLDFSLQNCVL